MTCIIRKVFPSGLAKSIFGILFGAGGVVSPVPVAYVTISRNNYETLGKKQFSKGGPICSWESQTTDGKKIRILVVYDSLKGRADPGADGGVVRFLQGAEVDRGGGNFHWHEITKTYFDDMIYPKDPKDRGNQWWAGYGIGSAKGEYGNTDVYKDWGERNCGKFTDYNQAENILNEIAGDKRKLNLKKTCFSKAFTIRCEISVADGGTLNWRDEDKPVIIYSVF